MAVLTIFGTALIMVISDEILNIMLPRPIIIDILTIMINHLTSSIIALGRIEIRERVLYFACMPYN